VDLIPYLKGEIQTSPHEALYWRWVAQAAIREGNWKLLRGGNREYLYDLGADLEEKHNLTAKHPEIAARLRAKLTTWSAGLNPPGLATSPMAQAWTNYYDYYLDGKTTAPATPRGWEARNGALTEKDDVLELTPEKGPKGKSPFIVRSQLKLEAPVTAKVALKIATAGQAAFAWRTNDQKDFLPGNRASFAVASSDDWQTFEIPLPATGMIVHVRLHLPGGTTLLREINLQSATK
jgi:uncharacterized sulfatase